jgi:AraC-like DNA-binding protein
MPHLDHAQWIQNLAAILVVHQFAGPHWMPATFAFQSRYCPNAETQSFWPNTRFLSGQTATWIEIPVSLLSRPVQATNRVRSQSQEKFRPIDTDIVNTLKLMLSSYLDEYVPTIAEAAEITGTSVRSLQRELSAADLSYSRLLEQVRFEKGAELLRKTDAKVIDVAHATGYANPSHFTRAFRRMAGVTPREFREISAAR